MEFFIELLFEFYLELAEILIPDRKFKKWQETLLKLAGILVSLIILACIGAGIGVLIETTMKTLGIALITVGGASLLLQVVLFVIVLVHQIKKEKRGKQQTPDCSDPHLNSF